MLKQALLAKSAAVGLLIAAASACSGPVDPSKNQTKTFQGSVQPGNTGPVHTFDISNTGEISVAVTSMTPGNAFLGVGYGQLAGNNCGLLQQNAVGSTNIGRAVLTGSIILKGTYCVVLFDPAALLGIGLLVVPQNYTVTVSYP